MTEKCYELRIDFNAMTVGEINEVAGLILELERLQTEGLLRLIATASASTVEKPPRRRRERNKDASGSRADILIATMRGRDWTTSKELCEVSSLKRATVDMYLKRFTGFGWAERKKVGEYNGRPIHAYRLSLTAPGAVTATKESENA